MELTLFAALLGWTLLRRVTLSVWSRALTVMAMRCGLCRVKPLLCLCPPSAMELKCQWIKPTSCFSWLSRATRLAEMWLDDKSRQQFWIWMMWKTTCAGVYIWNVRLIRIKSGFLMLNIDWKGSLQKQIRCWGWLSLRLSFPALIIFGAAGSCFQDEFVVCLLRHCDDWLRHASEPTPFRQKLQSHQEADGKFCLLNSQTITYSIM